MDSNHDKEGTADTERKQSTPTAEQEKSRWSPFVLLSSILCVNFRDVFPFKAYNFSTYGGFGCLLPYLPLYFKQLGLSATRTGVLIGVRPLSIAIGAPFWGIVSDKYKKRRAAIIAAVLFWILKHLLILPVQPHNEICLKFYDNKTASSPMPKDYIIIGNVAEHEVRKRYVRFQKPLSRASNKGGRSMEGAGPRTSPGVTSPGVTSPGVTSPGVTSPGVMHASQIMSKNAAFSPKQQNELRQLANSTTAGNHTLRYELWIDSKEMTRIFFILLLIVMLGEIMGSAVHSVVDACVVDYLGDERASYGGIRLWGSLGIAAATMLTGAVIHSTGFHIVCGQERENYIIAFYIFAGFMTLGLLSSFFMKIVYREPSEVFLSKTVQLLFNSVQKSSFWFITLCLGFLDGFQMDFTSWFLDDLGASSVLVGLAATLHFCVNTASFFVSVHILKAIGYANTITLGLLLYAVFFVALSLATNAWLAVVWYALLGMAFSISWSASVVYSGLISTNLGLGAVAQGFLYGIYIGGGQGGGTIVGGVLIDIVGIRTTYQIYAGLAIVAVVLYNALQWIGAKRNDEFNKQSGAVYEALPTDDD